MSPPCFSPPAGCLSKCLLTSGYGSHKTESVSALHNITGDALPVQVVLSFFGYAHETLTTCPAKAPRRRAAESRTHFGGRQGGVHPVGRKCQPGRHRQTGRCWAGDFVSPLSHSRGTSTSGLSV